MRQFVRSGWVASIVVGLAAVAGAQAPSTGPPAKSTNKAAVPPRPAILDQVLATVNGESITRDDLYKMLEGNGIPPGADASEDQSIYDMGIEGLVNSRLVKQYLKKQAALAISEKEIDAEFADFAEKLKKDGQDVYVALASHGVSVALVRDEMTTQLRWRKYLDLVGTDVNLKKFVAENKDYFNRTQVQASHIGLRIEPTTSAADKEKLKQKLLAIKQEIVSGKITFADAANKYSDDDGNKTSPRGGDLGYFVRRGQYNEQFSSVAFGLKKGAISDVVETPYGYHLIMVTDRKDGTPVDFEQNKLLIRNEYAADLHERIVAAERKTAKIKIEKMPADLFPKAQPPQAPTGTPPTDPAKTATPAKGGAPR